MNRDTIRPLFSAAARALSLAALAALPLLSGCGDDTSGGETVDSSYVLSTVVIDADGSRTTYVQTIGSLDDGPFTNNSAIEIPGNGVILASGPHFFVGLTEEPTWIRYTVEGEGVIAETGRLSFLNLGAPRIDFGNAIVDEDTAVSVLSDQAVAVVWNTETMAIEGEIDLSHLVQETWDLEVWTTIAHEGLVYIPGRWADWEGGRIRDGVSLTIVDPGALGVVGVAEDDRCASGGRVVFDAAGYGYVIGDGRNYSTHMFANARGETAMDNCVLRIAPGETDFEEDYYYTIPSLTGGLQSISELETAAQGTGVGFVKMFYPEELPEGMEPVDFTFWNATAHKQWRIVLADPPVAVPVQGAPFSAIGFNGSAFEGKLYSGESSDANTTDVYELDPETNTAVLRFQTDGYFNGLYELQR